MAAGEEPTEEEYAKGLEALSALISGRQRAGGKNWAHAFDMMQSYLERLGLDQELPKLSVIHVAGTKGKGSTCAMVERVLRECGYRTALFTSPHLVDVRERIRINGQLVDRATFLRNLWWCLETLKEKAGDDGGKPAYFRFLTLLGFKTFLDAGVDVAVLEVGLGGRLDATNCVRSPVVCGVSSLGYDHMDVLGHTLREIATEKAGIFKTGVPAFTVPQPEEAMQALQERAAAVGTPLTVVRPLEAYDGAKQLQLGLAGAHQQLNASLAVALAGAWEASSPAAAAAQGSAAARRAASVHQGVLPPEYSAGLQLAQWAGRAQVVHDDASTAAPVPCASSRPSAAEVAAPVLPRLSFFLDGAHTAESLAACAHWFADATTGQPAAADSAAQQGGELITQRVLLFNCMQERNPQNLLGPLVKALMERRVGLQHALFVPPDSMYSRLGAHAGPVDLSWQQSLRAVWESSGGTSLQRTPGARPLAMPPLPALVQLGVQDSARGAVLPNLATTLDWLRRCVREVPTLRMQVLVTGSLYLVGDLLRQLGRGA